MFKILRFFSKHSAGELVCARSRLPAAGIAQKFCRNIFSAHAFAEFGNRLQVAVASARKADVSDFVAVARELNRRCANAFSLESLFHTCLENYVHKLVMNIGLASVAFLNPQYS